MASNPISVEINIDNTTSFSCRSGGKYYQRITIYDPRGGDPEVFSGVGEGGVPMLLPNGANELVIDHVIGQPYTLMALFEYSTNGPEGPFLPSEVTGPFPMSYNPTTIEYWSEDGNDGDLNDSKLTIVVRPE